MSSEEALGVADAEEGQLSAGEERFEQVRKGIGFWLAPLAFGIAWLAGLGRLEPQACLLCAVLAAVLVLWVTESVPLPVTALFGACLCVVLGVADAKTVLAPFADPIVFLFIGSFMLARGMMLHGLDRRFALALLSWRWAAASPRRLLFVLGLGTAALSMWVSNTATTAMMLPIALGLLRGLDDLRGAASSNGAPHGRYGTGVMLMVAYAASVGGIGTPIGSPPNLIGLGFLRKLAGVEISFFQWMALCLPLLLAMYAALFLLLQKLHPPEPCDDPPDLGEYLRREREALGPWTRGQANTLVAFSVAVTLWLLPGLLGLVLGEDSEVVKLFAARLPESVVALVAAGLLFVLPVDLKKREFTLDWSQAARIDWGTILLFGGGLTLGGLLFSTGVAEVMGRSAATFLGADSLWRLTAVSVAVGIVMSEATSNTAAATMIVPVVIGMATANHINPVAPTLGACLGASYGFMLPVSTPPNAIVYGSGLVPMASMIRAGVLFDLLGFVVINLGLRLLCPLLGLT